MDDRPFIALKSIRHGDVAWEPGDLYDEADVQGLTERQRGMLVEQRFVARMTPELYRNAMARRPLGSIGRGFTRKFLEDMGLHSDTPDREGEFARRETDVERNGYLLRGRQAGVAKLWSVFTPLGEVMHAKEFRSLEKLHEFVDGLEPWTPAPSTDSGASDSQEAQEDRVDGLQLQEGS